MFSLASLFWLLASEAEPEVTPLPVVPVCCASDCSEGGGELRPSAGADMLIFELIEGV